MSREQQPDATDYEYAHFSELLDAARYLNAAGYLHRKIVREHTSCDVDAAFGTLTVRHRYRFR